MKPKFRSLIAAFAPLTRSSLIVCASLCAATSVHADQTWTGDALDGFWSSTGNWNGGAIPGSSDVAIFDLNSDTNTATTLGATFSIKGLKIADPIAAVSIAAGNTLTLDSSGIDMSTATQNLSIASPVVAGVAQSWNVGTGRTLTVTGEVSGTSFTKSGDGTVLLTVANTMAGNVQLNGGQITVRNGGALGPAATNTLNQANGTTFRIENNGGSTSTFDGHPISIATASSVTITSNSAGNGYFGLVTGDANSVFNVGATGNLVQVSFSLGSSTQQFGSFLGRVEIADGGSIRFSSTSGLNNGGASAIWDTNTSGNITARNSGTVNLGSLVGAGSLSGSSGASGTTIFSIGGRSENCTYDGTLVDATPGSRIAALTKAGTATLTLTSATGLTYGGATNVDAGTLKINGVKSGTGNTTVKNTTTLAGTGSIAGTTTIQNGGTLAPGDAGIGNLTFSNLTLNTGSKLNLEFGVGNDKATVSSGGTLTLQSGINVDVNGYATDGTYTIINYTGGSIAGAPASTAFSAVNGGSKAYTFADTGSAITMTISSADPNNFWNVDGGGTWNAAGNWTKNEIPNAIGAIAKVGPGIGGAGGFFTPTEFAITLDASYTIGTFVAQIDNISTLTIDPGTPEGTLSFDNGASSSILSSVLGNMVVNAPVAVDAQGLSIDVAMRTNVTPNTPFVMTLNGVVSGSGASLTKSGLGTLVLAGDNTYSGGTVISSGIVNINSATSLGNSAGAATFTGGTLQLANAITGVTRSYQVSGASNAIIDTNGFNFGYDGVISPLGGATGGLSKIGGGTMTLTAAQTYTGPTSVTGGTLAVAGGSLTNSAAATVTTAGITLSSGSIAFNGGLNGNTGNPSSNVFINLTGGTFSTSSLSMGRSSTTISNPTQGNTTSGLYINGATASVTGALSVGLNNSGTNSTASARIDSGSLTVDGAVLIAVASPDRWSVMDVNGGTFTSTNVATGVQIGSGQNGSVAFLVRNGTATVERFLLQQPAASTETSLLNVSGGTLYIGSGGIVGNNNSGVGILDVQLGTATLGAKASWNTSLGATLNGTTTIKAADAADAPFDIGISGVLVGTGGLDKTGGGKLTLSGINTYTGNTTVSAGILEVTNDDVFGDASTVTIASGATLNLTHSGTDQVGVLVINGVTQPDGLYTFGTGKLQVGAASSAYAAWATSFGLQDPWLGVDPALNGTPGADPDNDGIANELEFALGGNPTLSSTNILPTLTVTATDFIYTFNRVDASEAEVALTFQSSTTLAEGSWTPLAIGADTGSSGAGVVVVENGAAADAITVTISKGANTKLFGRLQSVK
jgi:autotransporter-associated beta strand protein